MNQSDIVSVLFPEDTKGPTTDEKAQSLVPREFLLNRGAEGE